MRNNLFPRPIRPENVELGDRVRVTYKRYMGVQTVYEGVVATRDEQGDTRHMFTAEGGRLFVWSPHRKSSYTLELLSRAPVEQPALFEADIEPVRERIA